MRRRRAVDDRLQTELAQIREEEGNVNRAYVEALEMLGNSEREELASGSAPPLIAEL